MRLPIMQICPWWKNEPKTAASTASSRSASSSTTIGPLPPSSSASCLIPAFFVIPSPTGDEPVKETTRGVGCSTIASPISEPEPMTTFSRPSGSPASSKTLARSSPPVTGVSPAGLSTTALPTASAGATDRLDSCMGKFHGEMTATTPAGWR